MDHELHAQTGSAKLPRRQFLRDAMPTTVASTFVSGCHVTSGRETPASLGVETMDQALDMMARLAPLTNHGPMAAEALVSLGRADQHAKFSNDSRLLSLTRSLPLPVLTVSK